MTQAEIHTASLLTHTADAHVLNQKTSKLLNFAAKMKLTFKPTLIQFMLKLRFWYEVVLFVIDHINEIVEYINEKKKNV